MLVIKNARVIDGTGAPPVENRDIFIERGKIRSVGCAMELPPDADIINAAGKTVIPGLIDAHTHMGGSSSFNHPSCGAREETYGYTEAREGFLRWGVTSVRSCGDQYKEMLAFRGEASAGKVLSPRIVCCGPFIQAVDGHPWGTVYMRDEKVRETAVVFAGDSKSIEEQVDEIAALGVDFIKVFYAHLNKMDYPNPAPRLTRGQLERVIASAHRNGLKCAVHVDGPSEMLDAVRAGADSIEHMIGAGGIETVFSGELIKAVKDSGAVVVPTMISILRFDATPGFLSVWDALKKAVKQFYDAGIPMAAGCDSGIPFVPFGESLHDELSCLVQAGIPELEALSMATLGAARVLGLDGTLGSIESGKNADLVILGADPLDDIENTRKIDTVLLGGAVVFQTAR